MWRSTGTALPRRPISQPARIIRFTSICRLNLALYLRAVGQSAAARESSATALYALGARLGNAHPWTLIASVNHACLLASMGELRERPGSGGAQPTPVSGDRWATTIPTPSESRTNVEPDAQYVAQTRLLETGCGQRDEWGGMDVDVPQT